MSNTPERIRVRWAGRVVTVDVVRRFKNGRIRVEHYPNGTGYKGGRFGTPTKPERMTVEPWQVVA